ncbi:MAG TPA: hypothetical protein VM223_09505, partial [Planctomycetota bacterium]|nr:hypothetical protein [Planctomycetota bacterium]
MMLNRKSERAFALLMVVLILTGLLIIGVPFAVSMRMSSSRARTTLAGAHARYGAEGAFNHAIACLMRTQEQHDPWPVSHIEATDTSFESHTVDIPAELEVPFERGPDPDLDLGPHADTTDDPKRAEVAYRDPRGTIWSVDVEDEQGKVNLNSASRPLLENLFMLLFDVDETRDADASIVAAAKSAAAHILEYRKARAGFHSVSEAESLLADYLKGNTAAPEGVLISRLADFPRYATVSSERSSPQAPHAINVNSAPKLVLAAALMNLRLHTPLVFATRATGSTSNGSIGGIVRESDNPGFDGDWTLTFTDTNQAQIDFVGLPGKTLSLESGESSVVFGEPFNLPLDSAIRFNVNEAGTRVLSFTLYRGTEPFQKDDKFSFSTRRITRKMAERLAETMQARVKIKAGDTKSGSESGSGLFPVQAFTVEEPPDTVQTLGKNGHLALGLRLLQYDSGMLTNFEKALQSGTVYQMRRVITCIQDLESLRNVIEKQLSKESETTPVPQQLEAATVGMLAAIKLNACRQLASELEGATAPFRFSTADSLTITGRASVSDAAGNEAAVAGVRRIVSIRRSTPYEITDSLSKQGAWQIDTDLALLRTFAAKAQHSFFTVAGSPDNYARLAMPNNYYSYCQLGTLPNDFHVRNSTGTLSLRSRHLANPVDRLLSLGFDGGLGASTNALSYSNAAYPIPPLASLPYGQGGTSAKIQNSEFQVPDDSGAYFTNDNQGHDIKFDYWPRLAYSTTHAPIPGLCKSIQMWVKWGRYVKDGRAPVDWPQADDYFLFDSARPYATLDSPTPSDDQLKQFCHENRIAIYYSGRRSELSQKTNELIFRISDATMAGQSAELHYWIDPAELRDRWHHIQVVWTGMGYGEMALLVDGKAASDYYPKAPWQSAGTEYEFEGYAEENSWPVMVGNRIYEKPDSETSDPNVPARGTSESKPDPGTGDPVTIYGYEASFVRMNYGQDSANFNDLAGYRSSTLMSAIGAQPKTKVVLPPKTLFIGPDVAEIPVVPNSTGAFQDKGFLLLATGEIVYYSSKTESSFICMSDDNTVITRGIGIDL